MTLVSYGQFLAALCTARSQYATTVGGSHSLTETMLVIPSAIVGLECSFHCFIIVFIIFGLQNYRLFLTPANFFVTLRSKKTNVCQLIVKPLNNYIQL